MELALWSTVFILSLAALIKGADWFLQGSERFGLALGLSPFIVGVTIVGIGTSLPELLAGTVAAFQGLTDIATANAIGSNIANILLVVGLLAVFSHKIVVKKDLIDLDLPLLAIATILFVAVTIDRQVTSWEAVLLLAAYVVYLLYTVHERMDKEEEQEALISLGVQPKASRWWWPFHRHQKEQPLIRKKDYVYIILGPILLAVGAKYVVDSIFELSVLLEVGTEIIAMLAVAFGTSLPELLVSITAAKRGKVEVALGNIIGSSVFNLLMVVGIPAVVTPLILGYSSFIIGLPMLLAATFLFIFSGISRRIHIWDGAMYLILYIFFVGKTIGIL